MINAYARVSTDAQADSGLGLDAQRQAIEAWAAKTHPGEQVEWFIDAGASGKDMHRPQMQRLLSTQRRGDVLIVSKLDRISRSLADFAALLERSQKEGWSIVALDLGLDLSTPTGRLVAGVMASVAAWERDVIAQRTSDALAQAKRRGKLPGRRSRLPRHVQDRLLELAGRGLSLAQVADVMNAEGHVTATGCRWGVGSVHGSTRSARLERDAEAALSTVSLAEETGR